MLRLSITALVAVASAGSVFADVNSVKTACQNRVTAHLIQGAVIGMVSDTGQDEILCGDAGSDREEFELGSISKSFAGIAAARLSLEGKIDLEAPISTYVPELEGSYVGSVSAHLLATHSARLVRSYSDAQHTSAWLYDESKLIAFLKAYVPDPSVFPPGIRVYSNLGFGVLGLVLSRVENQNFANVIKAEVLEPLAMEDTGFILSAMKPNVLAQGYNVLLQPVKYWPVSDLAIPAGGVFSDLHDMMIFLRANIHPDGSELGRAMALSQSLGLGWDSLPGELPIRKNGAMSAGFSSTISFDPTQGLGAVVLGNEFNSPSISTIGSVAMGKPDTSVQVKLDSEFIASAVGKYSSSDHSVEVDVMAVYRDYLGLEIKTAGVTTPGRLLSLAGTDTKFSVDGNSTASDRVEFNMDPDTEKMELTYFEYVDTDSQGQPNYRVTELVKNLPNVGGFFPLNF